jgi:hypothetical protein
VQQKLGATAADVYRLLLYRHCSELPEHMASVDCAAQACARVTSTFTKADERKHE